MTRALIRRDLAIVAAVGLLTNFGYLFLSHGNHFYPDSATYLIPAQSLLNGLGFVSNYGVPETLRTPGYPLFLVPFLALHAGARVIVAFQHLFNVALICGVYLLSVRRTGDRLTAFAAALLLALDIPSIHYADKVLTETLFTAMLFGALLLAWRLTHRPSAILAALLGLYLGTMVLVRPVAIAFFALVALFLLLRSRWRAAIVLTVAATLIPAAWATRNYVHTRVFTVASIAGTNMLLYRGAGALAIVDGRDFHSTLTTIQNELLAEVDQQIIASEGVQSVDELPHAVLAQYYGRRGRELLEQHPVGAVLLTCRGLLVNLFDSDWEALAIESRIQSSIIQLAANAALAFVILLACVGLASLWSRNRPFAMLLAFAIVYFVGMSAGGEAESRFRGPVMPEIAILAGAGVSLIRGRTSRCDLT